MHILWKKYYMYKKFPRKRTYFVTLFFFLLPLSSSPSFTFKSTLLFNLKINKLLYAIYILRTFNFFLLSLFTQGCLVPVLPRRVRKKKPFSGLESTIKCLQSRSNNPTVSNYKKIRNRAKTFFNNQYC